VAAVLAQGRTIEELRARVTPPAGQAAVTPLIPFDAAARKALELTFRQALRLGHDRIGTGHVLLALLDPADGLLDLDRDAAERTVLAGPQEP
jgi:hypothetical protein